MLKKLKSLWRTLTFKESQLTKGSVFYGPANVFMKDEIEFAQGTEKWKDSTYSFKLVVDKIEANKVYYYSYYIDPEGNESISKHTRFISTSVLLSNVNNLRLWADV